MQVMPSCASSRMVLSTSLTVSGSSAAVISSNSITSGRIASERAIATRCCWPPDSSPGYTSAFAARPTFFSNAMARTRTSPAFSLSTWMGAIITFSSAVLCGNRLYCWNTIDTSLRSAIFCWSVVSVCTSNCPTRMAPLSIGTRPLMHRSSVDLPEPDGPMMQTTPALGTSIDIPFNTWTSPNDLWTSRTVTIDCAVSVDMALILAVDGVTGLEPHRPARDREAVEEEQDQHAAVEREQQAGPVLRAQHAAGQRHDLGDADDRRQHRRHRQDGVQVHPWRHHPLDALRQDDHPHRLPPRECERCRRLPLPGRDRLHGAAQDLRHIRHHRQREAERRLDPVGNLDRHTEHAHLERQQEHAIEQQHQPWRVAEELRDHPCARAHRA